MLYILKTLIIGSEILVPISMDFTELSQIHSPYYSVSQIESFFVLIYGQAIDSDIESIGPINFFQCK